MKEIITADGSLTFYDESVGESYHSSSGAVEEAFEKFARPCGVASFQNVDILDVCFGLGYNSAAAIDLFVGKHITITALENDPKILAMILSVDVPFRSYGMIRCLAGDGSYSDDRVSLSLIVADARVSVKSFADCSFDIVFFDPFSPKKALHMWTLDFFSDIFRVLRPGAVFATYSCARVVRDALRAAGFVVSDGPRVGRRAPSTIATKPF